MASSLCCLSVAMEIYKRGIFVFPWWFFNFQSLVKLTLIMFCGASLMFYPRQRTIEAFKYNFPTCCVVSDVKGHLYRRECQ